MSEDANVRVLVRFRPLNEREQRETGNATTRVECEQDREIRLFLEEGEPPKRFTFDRVFFEQSSQIDIYELAAKATVEDVKRGYNGTIFAYGQTGSGKSYTMFGPRIGDEEMRGVIPRACVDILDMVQSDREEGIIWEVGISFLELYNERINDLINTRNKDLKVTQVTNNGKRSTIIRGLHEERVDNINEVWELLIRGEQHRAQAATQMNQESSRSHSIFIMKLRKMSSTDRTRIEHEGKLYLVDLAGSEKLGKTGAVGTQAEEAKSINVSLTVLGRVIKAIGDIQKARDEYEKKLAAFRLKKGAKARFPPFKPQQVPIRESQLTRILQDSLMGNTKTTLVVCCSASRFNIDETMSTLAFARRARAIRNTVQVNKHYSVDQLEAMVAELTRQVEQLTKENKTLRAALQWYKENTGLQPPSSKLLAEQGIDGSGVDVNGVEEGEGEGSDDDGSGVSGPAEPAGKEPADGDSGEDGDTEAGEDESEDGALDDEVAENLDAVNLRVEMREMEMRLQNEVAEWEQKFYSLKAEHEEAMERAEAALDADSELKEEMDMLKATIENERELMKEANDSMHYKLKEVEVERDELAEQLESVKAERDAANSALAAKEEEIEELKEYEESHDRLQEEFNSMLADTVAAEQAAKLAEAEAKRALEAEEGYKEEISGLTKAREELNERIGELEVEQHELKAELIEAHDAICKAEAANETAEDDIHKLKGINAELAEQVEAARKDATDAENQAEHDVEEALLQLDEVEARAQASEDKIARLEKELAAMSTEYATQDDAQSAQMQSLREEVDAANKEKEAVKQALEAKWEASKREVARLEREVSEANSTASKANTRLAEVEEKCASQRDKIVILEHDVEVAKEEKKEADKQHFAAASRLAVAAMRNDALDTEVAELKAEILKLKGELATAEAADSSDALLRTQSELKSMEGALASAKAKSKEATAKLREKQEENLKLTQDLASERIKSSHHATKIEHQSDRIAALEDELAELRGRIDEANEKATHYEKQSASKDERIFELDSLMRKLQEENTQHRLDLSTSVSSDPGAHERRGSSYSPLDRKSGSYKKFQRSRTGSMTAMEEKIDFSKLKLRNTDSDILKSAQRESALADAKFRKHMEQLSSFVDDEVKEDMAFGW